MPGIDIVRKLSLVAAQIHPQELVLLRVIRLHAIRADVDKTIVHWVLRRTPNELKVAALLCCSIGDIGSYVLVASSIALFNIR